MSSNFGKIILSLVVAVIVTSAVEAEDIIVFKDGSILKSKVEEVSKDVVKYRKASNPQGPVYTVSVGELLSITYENGESDKFSEPTEQSLKQSDTESETLTNEPVLIEKPASADNTGILAMYKNPHDFYKGKKASSKPTDKGTAFYAFTENSILSNEDLTITFQVTQFFPFQSKGAFWIACSPKRMEPYYIIGFVNKTKKPIYVDLANSYTMGAGGSYQTFYDDKVYNETRSSGSGGSFNLGGITNALGIGGVVGALSNAATIGGGSSKSLTITSAGNRFLTIQPGGSVILPARKHVRPGTDVAVTYEYFPRPQYDNLNLHEGEVRYFDEGEIPYLKFSFAYSDKPSFATYSRMDSELYCYEIIGGIFDEISKDHFKRGNMIGISENLHNGLNKYNIYQRFERKPCVGIPTYNTLNGKRVE